MTNSEPNSKASKESAGIATIWGIVGVVVMIYLLSKVGVPQSILKNFLPIGARQALANSCDECGGDGTSETTCTKCFGRGYYEGVKCTTCNQIGKVEKTCRFCGGSGKKPQP